jgi:hypothetical protein
MFEGFTEGVLTAAAVQAEVAFSGIGCEGGRIGRLCRDLGWSVDECDGNVIRLHFKSTAGCLRKVEIANGDDELVTFSTYSFAVLPACTVPGDVLAYLLRRNCGGSGIGTWGMTVDDADDVVFHLTYLALGDGLDPPTLKFVCESLCAEAAVLDHKMREAKLLR